MRIGEFARKNNLTIDTVRYYIDLNLLYPIRKGNYFYFEEEEQRQLDRLLYLKKLNFSLEEIKKIMSVEKLSKIETPIESSTFLELLLAKKENLERQMNELNEALVIINQEINHVRNREKKNHYKCGIALRNLELISCPQCDKPITIEEGTLKHNSVFGGIGVCSCGFQLYIDEGIIIVDKEENSLLQPYQEDHNYIDEFVNQEPKAYIDFMMKCLDDVTKVLLNKDLSDKKILFMKSGLGPVELNLLGKSTDIGCLILVDEDLNKLKVAKKSIEGNFPQCNVLYLCSELNTLPLKKYSIDLAVDFLALFLNGFRVDYDIYQYTGRLLKNNSQIVGLYMYFKKADMFARINREKWKFYDYKGILKLLQNQRFSEADSFDEMVLKEGSNINNFFKPGDEVYARLITFNRIG